MKAKFLISLLIATGYLLISWSPIFAHTLKTDGSIGAVIHIDPEDDPIIGEPAYFFFDFKDKDGKFKAEDCTCVATISRDNQVLATQTLAADTSLQSSSFSYTFPEKGVYHIEVSGQPLSTNGFQSFKLNYDLRVERTSNDKNSLSFGYSFLDKNFHLIALGIILVVFLTVFFLGKRKTKSTNLKDTNLSCFVLLLTLFLIFQYGNLHHLIPQHHQNQDQSTDKHLPCCSPPQANLALAVVFSKPILITTEKITNVLDAQTSAVLNSAAARSPPPDKFS